AIAFMHGYRYPVHEEKVAEIAKEIGFPQVSVSHKVSPLMKLVSRGDTTVVDAYLSPILRRYVDQVAEQLGTSGGNGPKLMFMQSNGGLIDARLFQGKDAILSGPAGGVVGMVKTAAIAGSTKLIGFDMGGTSTDVAHYNGEYERSFETEVAGVRMRAPMMHIHTVAAGGGSLLNFDGARYRVGPESAGANPGPACYRRGGPLAVTDCNVMLGKIHPDYFPKVFGPDADQPLDTRAVREGFLKLSEKIAQATATSPETPEKIAEGFLRIAVENMANAIKKISVQRGYDVTAYTLNCFGGAGGQHACLVADALGMKKVFLHPFAGVLSAYGMGLADIRSLREVHIEHPLVPGVEQMIATACQPLIIEASGEVQAQGIDSEQIQIIRKAHLRYQGTDSTLFVDVGTIDEMTTAFEQAHKQRFGFIARDRSLVIEALSIEAVGTTESIATDQDASNQGPTSQRPHNTVQMVSDGQWQDA
ncbi:MAG: hydantoinase/oxoprolinase family protein, partial [Deltaproteobacteria bacterium]